MKRSISLYIVAVLSLTSTGGTKLDAGRDAVSQSVRMFKPNPHDGPLEMDSETDEWDFVGKEGRAEQEREQDPDRWWQNLMMSQEARNIERNLGID